MIIKFKLFENSNGLPEEGDYVILFPVDREYVTFHNNSKMNKFITSNIGKVENFWKGSRLKDASGKYVDNRKRTEFVIKYDDIPQELMSDGDIVGFRGDNIRRYFWISDGKKGIQYWSKNREDLEHYVASKKFNL